MINKGKALVLRTCNARRASRSAMSVTYRVNNKGEFVEVKK